MENQPNHSANRQRFKELLIAALVVALAWLLPKLPYYFSTLDTYFTQQNTIGHDALHDLILLILAILLVTPSLKRSGVCLGDIRPHWQKVALVCITPVILVAIVFPLITPKPFTGYSATMWLRSPLAQALIFIGYLYGRLALVFPSVIHDKLRIHWALVIAALYFAAWHIPNFAGNASASFVIFQLIYTFALFIIVGLSRQWTGSVLYYTLTHASINFIAWYASQ